MYILPINSVIYLVFYQTLPIKCNFPIDIPTEVFRILKGRISQYTKMHARSSRKCINLQGHTSNSPLKAAPYTNIFLGTQPLITHLQANTVLKNPDKQLKNLLNHQKWRKDNWHKFKLTFHHTLQDLLNWLDETEAHI